MKIYRIIFACCIVSFITPNFGALFGRVGFLARYGLLAMLALASFIFIARRNVKIPPGMLAAYYGFITYAFATAFWSENVKLSIFKWIAYTPLCLTLLAGGIIVARPEKEENPFWPMKYVFVPIVVISFAALARGTGWINGNFRGYCGNSNALAATLMLASPWLVIELRNSWSNFRRRAALLSLSGAGALIMLLTFSRAALGGMFIIICAAGWGLKFSRKVLVGYALLGLLIALYVVRPNSYSFLYEAFVEKRAENVLKSRSDQLTDSWEAAKEGGMFGAGFGVSVGESQYWDMDSFSSFSREKGNSMLGIVEETGVAGLMLYLVLMYSTWGSLRHLSRPQLGDRFLYKLTVGFFLASIFHSAFEAWFLSSGPDVAVYWATLGLAIGALSLRSRIPNEHPRMEAAIGPRVFASPATPRR